MFEQTLEKPAYGWPSEGSFMSFPDLLTGWQYQVSLTIHTTVGSLPILGPRTVTVEEGSVSVPRTATSPHAWTMHRWVADGGNSIDASSPVFPAEGSSGGSSLQSSSSVTSALFVGWRNVAPSGSGLYTLTAMNNGQREPLTTSPVSGESALILGGSTWYDWCAHAAPPPQDITISDIGGGGTTGIIPPRPDPDLCVDPVTGVTYTYTWSTYATAHLGTVRAVVSDAPNNVTTVKKFDYEPFGVELPNPDNIGCSNTHKYTGHERDQETGNDYMHFRYFSASMGRFQKPDSVFDGASGNPQGFNLYSYVSGNPVNFNDPTGHAAVVGGDINLGEGRAIFLGIDVYAGGGGGGGWGGGGGVTYFKVKTTIYNNGTILKTYEAITYYEALSLAKTLGQPMIHCAPGAGADGRKYDKGSAEIARIGNAMLRDIGAEIGYILLSDGTPLWYVDDVNRRAVNGIDIDAMISWAISVLREVAPQGLSFVEVGHIEPGPGFKFADGLTLQKRNDDGTYTQLDGTTLPRGESSAYAGSCSDCFAFGVVWARLGAGKNPGSAGAVYTAYKEGAGWWELKLTPPPKR